MKSIEKAAATVPEAAEAPAAAVAADAQARLSAEQPPAFPAIQRRVITMPRQELSPVKATAIPVG